MLLDVALAALLPATPASGASANDPSDARGRLDLRRVVALKSDPGAPLRVTVATWEGWPATLLRRSGPDRLFVDLDTDADGTADVRSRVVWSGDDLVAELLEGGSVLERVPVSRPSARKLLFTIPSGAPANPTGDVAVAARSRVRSGGCHPCSDRAPDDGWVRVVAADGGDFTCTQVIGFSQTRQWFADAPDFENAVGSDGWQLLWHGGAEIQLWADPDYRGWQDAIRSPCVDGSNDPDRVILTISKKTFESDADVWSRDISDAVDTVRDKYPNVEQIALQPVVGGPNHEECTLDGHPVRASVNHPTIDRAIADVVGGDVVAGASPEVRNCDDYADNDGHLTDDATGPVGLQIAQFYG